MQEIRIHIQDRSHGHVLVEFLAQNGSKPSRSWIDHAAHRTMHFNFRGHRSRREPRAELARYVVPARELVLRRCVNDQLYRNAGRSNTATWRSSFVVINRLDLFRVRAKVVIVSCVNDERSALSHRCFHNMCDNQGGSCKGEAERWGFHLHGD
jgi:hypothetical protein